jgi:hypothetical protein
VAWLWVAIIFDHATRAIWLLVGFRGGKWKTTLRDRLAAAEAQS